MEHSGFFQFSVENALEVVIIFRKDGTIEYANEAAKKHFEYEAFHGMNINDIFPKVLTGDMQEEQELMAYRRNKTCFPMRVKFSLYEDKYICMASDVTNERFLEKEISKVSREAEEALKVKSEFVANVTHELRTPVNGILGNTKELIALETERNKKKLLNLVERGCNDMNSIINNILDFSKLEAGKFVLELREFHFRSMIDYVKSNHRNRITEKGLEFSVNVSPEVPEHIIGDELRLVQILNNLISNAYKFTSVGIIHIEVVKTSQSGNKVELFFMVRDTGIGIAKADQDKLFKSFSQVDSSISRKYGGTGLGLNICKQLIELMGGNIFVESNPGAGTVFSFNIWADISEQESYTGKADAVNDSKELIQKLSSLTENTVSENIWIYGEKENKEELDKKMSKLILCVEMENWEKAEMFAESIKQLTAKAPREIQSASLRLKMAVQKGEYERVVENYDKLNDLLKTTG